MPSLKSSTARPVRLRTRLTLWYIGVLALLLVVYATVVFGFQYAALTRQLYHDEVQDVVTAEGLLYFDPDGTLQLKQDYYSRPQSHLLVDRLMEVRDLSDHVLYRSSTLRGMPLGGPIRPGEGDAGFDERVIKLPDGSAAFAVSHIHTMNDRTLVIRLGYDLAPLRARMFQFFLLLSIAIPLALALAALAGQAIARRALRPLERMTKHAERITANDLGDRLDERSADDELGHMAQVFNHLLGRLEQAFRQLQRFTADASHELRTPLTAIRTISEVALEQQMTPAAYREVLGKVLEESSRLNQTIEALLLLSRAESLRPEDSRPAFVLGDLLREVVAVLEVLGEDRGIQIVQEGSAISESQVQGDRDLARIVFMNVVHNALKFSPQGRPIVISFSRLADSFVRIAVQDEGPGIASSELPRVFDRFFKSSGSATKNESGVGLGLAIAKLVVERAGGHIQFDEAYTRGARCLIDLPVVESAGDNRTLC